MTGAHVAKTYQLTHPLNRPKDAEYEAAIRLAYSASIGIGALIIAACVGTCFAVYPRYLKSLAS